MSKRLRSAAVPIVLLAIVAAACSKSSTGGSTNSAAPNCPSDFKVGLALDSGGDEADRRVAVSLEHFLPDLRGDLLFVRVR